MGRHAEPLRALILRGSKKAKYERQGREPEGELVDDPMAVIPAWLPAAARAHWMTIAPMVKDLGILTTSDTVTLAMLCFAIADFLNAQADVELKGAIGHYTTDEGGQGAEYQRPSVRHMHTAWANVIKASALFGLSPSDKSRIKLEPKKASGIATRKRA